MPEDNGLIKALIFIFLFFYYYCHYCYSVKWSKFWEGGQGEVIRNKARRLDGPQGPAAGVVPRVCPLLPVWAQASHVGSEFLLPGLQLVAVMAPVSQEAMEYEQQHVHSAWAVPGT